MCGISGILSWHSPPDREALELMNQRLIHRGPDAAGIYLNGPVGLAHRRLSIIDLSHASDQPMSTANGRYTLIFNGEIYNYRELRQELQRYGVEFRSEGDTEIILAAYQQWGVDCLERLNGMFAFALWDQAEQTLLLARDRLGEKPLFYQPMPRGGVLFASELKALAAHPQASRKISGDAIRDYLALNYLLTDQAALEGVYKLPPGHYLKRTQGGDSTPVRYWDLAHYFHHKNHYRSEGEAAEAWLALFDDAVRLRMGSDVPLGAFLSGGVDSSAVVAAMCDRRPEHTVRTFSMGFSERSYSELPEAQQVARFFHTDHQDMLAQQAVASRLPDIVYAADEPFADTSMIPMYLLSEFTRKQVTVSLSGDGADEIFCGYETYTADRLNHLIRWLPRPLVRGGLALVNRLWPVNFDKVSLDFKLRQFLAGSHPQAVDAHYAWRSIFADADVNRLLQSDQVPERNGPSPLQRFRAFDQEVAGCHYLDRMMYVDTKTWLADDILVKVDRTTMAHSLESRPPFLDHRLVEFSASLPVSLKMKGFQKKYLFKKSMRTRLPAHVLDRKKVGFNAPVSHWLGTSFAPFFNDVVRSGPLGSMLHQPQVAGLWQEHQDKTRDHGLKLFGLICLGLWMKHYEG